MSVCTRNCLTFDFELRENLYTFVLSALFKTVMTAFEAQEVLSFNLTKFADSSSYCWYILKSLD